MANPNTSTEVRNERYARHLRAQLEYRHAANPVFLNLLHTLTDEELIDADRRHHEQTVAAIKASQSRSESTKRIAEARKQQGGEVTSQFELLVTSALKDSVRRERSRRGVKR